jgi:hypothetical protein
MKALALHDAAEEDRGELSCLRLQRVTAKTSLFSV